MRFTCIFALLAACGMARADDYTIKSDIVYGRIYGTALTLDVISPTKDANGLGVIWVISGGWFSAHEIIAPMAKGFAKPLTDRGYTVIAVVHGCQPKFQIPEILEQMNRSVRFIRAHAKEYKIDPDHIGIYGGSAGGHLSLMQGVAPQPQKLKTSQPANPLLGLPDPNDQVSAKVQCVCAFFPPTDFLNYGKPGENAIGRGILKDFKGAFDFHELDPQKKMLVPITDEKRIEEIGKQISPIYHVDAHDPPTLIIHGDADTLVPYQQATSFVEKMKAVEVPVKLITHAGGGHGWKDIDKDMQSIGDFFDEHLKAHATTQP